MGINVQMLFALFCVCVCVLVFTWLSRYNILAKQIVSLFAFPPIY